LQQAGCLVGACDLPAEDEWRLLAGEGYLQRTDQQFHFENDGYASFEDFLAALSSRKRKLIRRERLRGFAGRR
jgi:predicted N-acyltransferase